MVEEFALAVLGKRWNGRSWRVKGPLWSAILLLLLTGAGRCGADEPWPLWESYTKRFLDDQGRVIDRSAADRTTSEGQAYAMFFSLVGNDRAHFDKLLNWSEANLAQGDLTLRLPAWLWGKSASGEWKTLDQNSASDADLWMVYTLLQAGRLWHEPRYEKLGQVMAARMAKQNLALIPNLGTTLLPGPQGFHPDAETWMINPSYLPLPLVVALSKWIPGGVWGGVLDSLPKLTGGKSSHQFAMDWVAAGASGVHPSGAPAEPTAGAHESHPAGSYDAIRVYLWLGMAAPGTPKLRELLGDVDGMAKAVGSGITPPLEVNAEGAVVRAEAPIGFSAAMIPYLTAIGMKAQAKTQMDRLTATRDSGSGLYGRPAEYYDQNLVLFSTGWSEERFRFERDGRLRVKWK
jgi:endo-1,4-beta-D-glucanase Y